MIVVRGVWPGVMQWLVVNPNQQEKERQYIAYNLEATRAAYKLDRDQRRAVSAQGRPHPRQAARQRGDPAQHPPVGPRHAADELPPAAGAAALLLLHRRRRRPLHDQRRLPPDHALGPRAEPRWAAGQAQTWVNQHITYTHGFGVVVSPVNQVTSDGSPAFLVKDVPPQSVPGLEIDEPRIYYGELGTDYTLVKTTAPEFDYPGASGDVTTSTAAPAASRSVRPGDGSPSPCASARSSSSPPTTSRPTAG